MLSGIGLAALGCQSDKIVSVDPDDAPGRSARTVEVLLDRSDVLSWLDTVFVGFTGPSDAGFLRIEEATGELRSRALIRFRNFPDSAFFLDTVSPIQRFDSAVLVFTVDTQASVLGAAGTTLQLRTVAEDWDARSASWEVAVDTPGVRRAWSSPGGDFGPVLGEVTITPETDTVVFSFGERSDSLIRAWDDTTRVNTGLAWVAADSGRVVARAPRLRYLVVPELRSDTSILVIKGDSRQTFIFDPSSPPLGQNALRVGGIQGWRIYSQVELPDSVPNPESPGRASLRGSTINRAELLLVSRSAPDPPFGASRAFGVVAVELRADVQTFGEKTPVGPIVSGSDLTIQPDSLSRGDVVRLNLTAVVQEWASTPLDSAAFPIRVTVRARPEAGSFGFWEFGASGSAPALRPVLRIVFTPPTDFGIP